MLIRITKAIQKELFNEERGPRTPEEVDAVAETFRKVMQRFKLLKYVPHQKQRWFHEAKAPIKCFVGGNQSGKTTALLAEILSWCLGEYLWSGEPVIDLRGNRVKAPIRALIGAEDFVNAHAEVILPKLNELLPLDYLGVEQEKLQGRVTHKLRFPKDLGGSTIKMMSYDQEQDKWEGFTAHIFGFDEPPPEYAVIGCKRGAMRHAAPICMSFTPLKEPWIYDQVYSNEKAIHIDSDKDIARLGRESYAIVNVNIADTPYLTEEAKARFVESLDEEEREARQHGRFRHLMGRVYKKFDRNIHVLPGDWDLFRKGKQGENWPCGLVVDPHDRKPWAMSWFTVTPRDEIIWIAEWPDFDFHGTKQWHWSVDNYFDKMNEVEKDLGIQGRVIWNLMDPNFGRTQKAGTGATLEDEMNDRGRAFDTQIDDKVELGHIAVRDALADPARIFWTERCVNGIRGMEHYTWSDYRVKDGRIKEAPMEQWKDFPDLSRYAVVYPVHYMDPMTTPQVRIYRNNGLG